MSLFNRFVKQLFIASLLTFVSSGSAFAIAGKFQFVNGEVQIINKAGIQHKVQKGDSVNEGDTVAAAADGFAQITMEDGGFFAVRPDTKFKVDTFQFNGKDDGSEKGVFSLIQGSLRSVTGLIGKKHRDNYKINTATATIGIRGSGADVGHSDALGTAVRTLFGGHSLTSGGKTIETNPGQTAFAPPGGEPKIVPNFPFSTNNGANGPNKQNGNSTGNNTSSNNNGSGNKNTGNESNVLIPVKDTEGNNFTTNTTADGSAIGSALVAAVGSGGAATGFDGSYQYQEVNVVDGESFSATTNSAGALTGWKSVHTYQDGAVYTATYGYAIKAGTTPIVDGTDSSLGVVWGRWAEYTNTYEYKVNGVVEGSGNYPTVGGLAFITGTHITTVAELNTLAIQNVTGTYNLVNAAPDKLPTLVNGIASGHLDSASATVDFYCQSVSFSVSGSGSNTFGNWTASGSGAITNGGVYVGLNGTSSTLGSISSGSVVGGFVGNQAQGLISTIKIQAGNDSLGAAAYLPRSTLTSNVQ